MKLKSIYWQYSAILAAVMIFLSGCASSTLITSDPSGAKLFIDGRHVGATPFIYSDTKIVGSKTTVRLEKEGYEPLNTFFTRTEEVDVGAVVGGIFVWPVFLWTMKYYPDHYYELYPLMRDDNNEDKYIAAPKTEFKSKADRLRELKQLYDEKLITESEYQKEREKILDED
jgi:hypothetical protein